MADFEDAYAGLSRKELQDLAKQRGLGAGGSNAAIMQRLREEDNQEASDQEEEVSGVEEDEGVEEVEEVEEEVAVASKKGKGKEGVRQPVFGQFQLQSLMGQLNEALSKSNAIQDEAHVKLESVQVWPDMKFEGRSEKEYDTLKVVGRELFVLSSTVQDKGVASRIAASHKLLKDRAATLYIGEKGSWAAAEATFLPSGSLFKEQEKRIDKALELGRKKAAGGEKGSVAERGWSQDKGWFQDRGWAQDRGAAQSRLPPYKRQTMDCWTCGGPHTQRQCPKEGGQFPVPSGRGPSPQQPFRNGGPSQSG